MHMRWCEFLNLLSRIECDVYGPLGDVKSIIILDTQACED